MLNFSRVASIVAVFLYVFVSLDRSGPGFIPYEDKYLNYGQFGPLEEKYYLLEEVWQSFECEAIRNFESTLACSKFLAPPSSNECHFIKFFKSDGAPLRPRTIRPVKRTQNKLRMSLPLQVNNASNKMFLYFNDVPF